MDSSEGKPLSGSAISGKLVIVGILFVAFWAAAISWYFRYNATHRAVKFWGAETAVLIRDAQVVTVSNSLWPSDPARVSQVDISHAHGLQHLRSALLEDMNFDWATVDKLKPVDANSKLWTLSFVDINTDKNVNIWFSDNFRYAIRAIRVGDGYQQHSVSTEPMAKGLREMFAEFSAKSAADTAAEAPPATPPAEPAR